MTPTAWPVFDPQSCHELRDRVLDLREFWTPRFEGRFYTLGSAAYCDAQNDQSFRVNYLPLAARLRPTLISNFGGLYEATRKCLEEALSAPCTYLTIWPSLGSTFGSEKTSLFILRGSVTSI